MSIYLPEALYSKPVAVAAVSIYLPEALYSKPVAVAAVSVLNSSSSPLANCNPTPNKLYINAINRNSSCDHSTYSTGCMYILYQYTVELYCLELERTVKMCSSYRKFEPPRFLNFREKKKSGSDPGQFHYAMITDAHYQWTFVVKKCNPLEISQRLRLLDTALISSNIP